MRKTKQKSYALKMRKQGMSYSQIKSEINVSKSTLSLWLKDFPLSTERISALRANSPRRIEKFRNTMRMKREKSFNDVFHRVSGELGRLSNRDILIGGIFLYWGEGSKSADYTTAVSNTDPSILNFFIKWLSLFGIKKDKLKISLHLYSDMNINKEIDYWSKELGVPRGNFKKPYVKKSKLAGLSYKNGFGHGTCNVKYFNKEMWQYTTMALKYIRENSV